MAISTADFNRAIENKKPAFTLNIEKDSKKKRSKTSQFYNIYYLNPAILDQPNEPIQFKAINSASMVKDKSTKKDEEKQSKLDTLTVITRLDLKDESEDEIKDRAEERVKELAEQHDIPQSKIGPTIDKEIRKIKSTKEFSKMLKNTDTYFMRFMRTKKTKAELSKFCEYDSGEKPRGMIHYERKLSKEELAEINEKLDEDEDFPNEKDDPKARAEIIKKYSKLRVNSKTARIILDEPMVWLEIGVDRRQANYGALFVDVYDLQKPSFNSKTGVKGYKLATVEVDNPRGDSKINKSMDYWTLPKFLTYGSLFTGMLEFSITISAKGPSLHAKLTNQMYCKRNKVTRVIKKVEESVLADAADLAEGFSDDDQEKEDNNDSLDVGAGSGDEYSE